MPNYMEELYKLPNRFIEDWKAKGKKVVGTVCCHIPEEIIHAAGVLPIRVRATGCQGDNEAALWMSSFSCSFARGLLEQMTDGTFDFMDGYIFSDGCDMIHRTYDNWDYIDESDMFRYQFVAPRVIHENSYKFFAEEIELMKEALEKWTGNKVTEEAIANSVAIYNESRVLMNQLYDLRKEKNPVVTGKDCLEWTLASQAMPKEIFNELLKRFLAQASKLPPITDYKARVVWAGGPVDEPSYLQLFEDKGALIVNDFQCFGRARNIDIIKPPKRGESWIDSIAQTYLAAPVCPRMVEQHNDILDIIVDLAEDFDADGIIYVWMKNCEIWGAELPRIVHRTGTEDIPVLTIEREQFQDNAGQVGIRVEAFLEMLEGGNR